MPGTPEGLPAVSDLINLGEQFFLWEMATAVAGAMLEINAFDQPNVQESKDYTKKYLETFTRTGTLPDFPPLLSEGDVKVYARPERCRPQRNELLEAVLSAYMDRVNPGDYFAINVYVERPDAEAGSLP